MASPQREKGHVRIANELYEAMCKIRIPGECEQVLKVIIRMTYGWNKKTNEISLDTFRSLTGITNKSNIQRAIKKLKLINIIIILNSEYKKFPSYCIQKDYHKWKPYSKLSTYSKQSKTILQNEYKPYSKLSTPLPIIKNNIKTTKDICDFFPLFWKVYPARNGKKLEKGETEKAFKKLSIANQGKCVEAAKNYANSQLVKDGIGIKDPKRFIKKDYWKDWNEPETGTDPEPVTTENNFKIVSSNEDDGRISELPKMDKGSVTQEDWIKIRNIGTVWNECKISDDIPIVNYWDDIIRCLRVGGYTEDQIKEAITNYGHIYHSKEYVYDFKWTIDQFLYQPDGIGEFLTSKNPFKNMPKLNSSDVSKKPPH